MRVLHVVRQYHPAIGGIENFVHCLSSRQRRAGIEAEVLTLDRRFQTRHDPLPRSETVDGVPVRRVSYFGSSRYPIAPSVLAAVRGFDLVHVHGVDFFCDFLACTAPIHGKPMVLSTHGGFFHTAFARHLKPLYFRTVTRAALTRYRRILACSQADAEAFSAIANGKLTLIENGVDTEKFAAAAALEFKPVLVYFGRFASHKGLERLLEAFDHAAERMQNASLLLIGNDWDGTYARLRQKTASAQYAGRVRIETDLRDPEIADRLRQCTFFVSASEYEGFGLTLVEALSAGLIPIVNCIASFQSIVGAAGVGHLTDFGNPKRAGSEIVTAMSSTRTRHAALRSAAIASSRRYAWENVERRIRAEYEDILGLSKRTILGVNFEPMTRREVVTRIDERLQRRKSTLQVVFANAHTLSIAARSASFRNVLAGFLVLNDGIGVDVASRIKFGKLFPENLNGTDFIPHYLSNTRHSLRIFLLGARPAVVAEAARRFAQRWPQHHVTGSRDGYFRDEKQIFEVCRMIKDRKVDLLLVGLGNPLQELWLAKYGRATGAPVQIGVGALFDFASGQVPRAPSWLRRVRCEWAYRLAREPRRLFSRYVFGGVTFLRFVLRDKRTGLTQ